MKLFVCAAFILTGLWLAAAAMPHAQAQGAWMDRYVLAPGDEVRITVAGEDDLSGLRPLDPAGAVTLPLVGTIALAGHEPDAAATLIADRLRDGYLRNPRVTVALGRFRPVYLLGGVEKPGAYPYSEGMTVLQAVAMGGGFSGGRDHTAQITRRSGHGELTETFSVEGTMLLPGDVLKINSRWRYHE